MEFKQVEAEFNKLKVQFETKTLTEADFKSKLEDLMIQDDSGHWWMIGYETGLWYRNDGTDWQRSDPPGYEPPQPAVAVPVAVPANTPVEKISSNGFTGEVVQKAAYPTTNTNIPTPLSVKKTRFFQTWFGRILAGGMIGIIFALFLSIFAGITGIYGYPFFDMALAFLVSFGITGFIVYPRLISIGLMIVSSIVAGIIGAILSSYYGSYVVELILNFLLIGSLLGFPAGALLSRVLHWIKVLK